MATVDSYSETNQDGFYTISAIHPGGGAGNSGVGQSFTGDGNNITSCKFFLKRTGDPGNLIARLYAHSGEFGVSSVPTGEPLDSSEATAASGVPTEAYGLLTFSGFAGYTLVDGTKYCIVVEGYDGTWDGSNYVVVGDDGTSPTHGGNHISWSWSNWAAHVGNDTCFYVYGEPPLTVPTVTTQAATDIEDTTATGNGNITNTGGENCDIRGIVWDLASQGAPGNVAPGASGYANDVAETDGFGTGAFTRSLTGLPTGDTIYARAYAHNSEGYAYGDEVSFLTKPAAPTNVQATDGVHTDKVVVTWTKSTGATGYKVYEGANLLDTLGDVATYDDTAAPAGIITPGTASAGDGASTAHVTLSLAGESVADGATRTYKVIALNATGDSDASGTNTGYRGTGSITYQWQRSDGDADSGYGNIGGATTDPYNDTGAPAPTITAGDSVATDGDHTDKVALSLSGTSNNDGAGRYFKCVLDATGTSQATSSVDRGYRGAGSLTYQWQKSSGDADEDYSNIDGATSSTHDDTAAPAPTITAGTGAATDGLTAYVTLSLSGESANVGAGRYYQCVLAAAPAGGQTATANRGHRGVGSLTYQWQISAGDSDASYSNISGATTEPYNHPVAHSDGRYYQCVENATGATEQTSSADRGWRKPLEVTDGDLIGIRIIRKS